MYITDKTLKYPVIDIVKTGKKIEALMKINRISVKQLQKYLGLSCVQSIYRWLEGVNLPSVDHLYAMSELFQVSIDDMICGDRLLFKHEAWQEGQKERLLEYYIKIQKLCAA